MRVAILSPQPRISGVVTYSHHLRQGFLDAGHVSDVITGTLSGKPSASSKIESIDAKRSGWGWSTLGADITVAWRDMVPLLDDYDAIIVEEPRCAPLDKRQLRKLGGGDIKEGRDIIQGPPDFEELPPYIQALAQLKGKKIGITLHDPGYMPRLAPFLKHFVEWVKPDFAITHRDGSYESARWAGLTCPEVRIEHLPYPVGRWEPWDKARFRDPRVGTTGRYINNKGQPTLFLAAALGHLPPNSDVASLGASPLGAGPNHTYLSFEGLTKRWGWVGTRDGGDVTRGWQWRAKSMDGTKAAYLGPYMSAVDALRPFAIHVCMTDPAFSGTGSLEYAQLEAVTAGCLLVMHESRVPKRGAPTFFEVEHLVKLANAELWPVDEDRRKTAHALGRAVTHAVEFVKSSPLTAEKRARANFETVRQHHQPRDYAARVIEAL